MDWFALALASAALFGVVNILEKHVISSRLPSIHPFFLILGTTSALFGTVFLFGPGLPYDAPAGALALAVVAALIFGIALVLMFLALQREEVSRVVPLRQMTPIFVAVLAVLFLNERLLPIEWVAMLVTVVGAVLISVRRNPVAGGIVLGRPFFLVVGSSLLVAISNVLAKEALAEVPVWTVFAINDFGIAIACYTVALRPSALRQLRQAMRQRTPLLIAVTAEVLATAASVAQFGAFNLGPISLATVVLATRPFFVLTYAVALSFRFAWVVDEPGGRETMGLKLAAITMIVGGVSVIALV